MKNPRRKFSPAQIAAQKLFAKRAKAGTLRKGKRRTRKNPSRKLFIGNVDIGRGYEVAEILPDGRIKTVLVKRAHVPGYASEQGFKTVAEAKNAAKKEFGYEPPFYSRAARRKGATRNPSNKIRRHKSDPPRKVDRFRVRGVQKTRTGYLYYYLRGDRFESDWKGADTFSEGLGEKKMREIQHKLPSQIAAITLEKAR